MGAETKIQITAVPKIHMQGFFSCGTIYNSKKIMLLKIMIKNSNYKYIIYAMFVKYVYKLIFA